MTRDYPGRVTGWHLVVGAGLVASFAATLVLLVLWLGGRHGTVLPAPAEPSDAEPGAVECGGHGVAPDEGSVEVTASSLIDCPDEHDGRTVAFTGEVIGAVFVRGGRGVVVLNDDDYALGPGPLPQARTALGGNAGITVVLPRGAVNAIRHPGNYRTRGDLVRVAGRFTAANQVLQGEPAIDADVASIVRPGSTITHVVRIRSVVAALVAATVALAMTAIARRDRVVVPRGRTRS
jgi:hypothetical protein